MAGEFLTGGSALGEVALGEVVAAAGGGGANPKGPLGMPLVGPFGGPIGVWLILMAEKIIGPFGGPVNL